MEIRGKQGNDSKKNRKAWEKKKVKKGIGEK